MDFDRISLLLGIIHNSINVPNTERLREAAMEELRRMNGPALQEPEVVPVVEPEPEVVEAEAAPAEEPELDLKVRRI